MRRVFYGVLSTLSALVLAGSYYFSLHDASEAAASTSSGRGSSVSVPSTAPSMAPSEALSTTPSVGNPPAPEATAVATLSDGSYTGASVSTRYGQVQVSITVSGGKIIDVQVPQYPQGGGREQRINAQAVPQLISETVQAQSAQIDMVSGATYTMNGYLDSLQSALDQARA